MFPPPEQQLTTSALVTSTVGNTTLKFSLSLPAGVTPESLALSSRGSLRLGDRVHVDGPFASFASVANLGSGVVEIGADAVVGNLWSASQTSLRSRARIEGAFRGSSLPLTQDGVTINGASLIGALSVRSDLTTWSRTFSTTNAPSVRLEPDRTMNLNPGSYGSLNVASRSKVTLKTGSYFFGDDVLMEPDAKVVVDDSAGPVFVFLAAGFTWRGRVERLLGEGVPSWLISAGGSQSVIIQAPFQGTIIAPDASLVLQAFSQAPHVGSFFAKDIEVQSGASVRHSPFAFWGQIAVCNNGSTPIANDDSSFYAFCRPSGRLPQLPAPISPTASKQIRDAFRWTNTHAVPNTDALGRPTLYYGLAYVEDQDDLDTLDALKIHWDTLPLFEVNRDQWSGQLGVVKSSFDGDGGFVYVVIPGLTYNILREAATCVDPAQAQLPLRAVQLIDVPVPEARNVDNTLSYDYLAQEGFRYRGLPNCPESDGLDDLDPSSDDACGSQATLDALNDAEFAVAKATPIGSGWPGVCNSIGTQNVQPWGIGKLAKRLAKGAVKLCKGAADLGRKGLAIGSRFFKGSTTLTVALEVRNSDPSFGGSSSVMLRPWGANRGSPVPLAGIKVRALQTISFSFKPTIPSIEIGFYKTKPVSVSVEATVPFDALSTGTADSAGVAKIKVVKKSRTTICVRHESPAGVIYNWIFPKETCSFGGPSIEAKDLTGPRSVTVPFADNETNVMAQLTEGSQYLRQVAGHSPKRAEVLVGPLANLLSSQGRAYTPCFGYPMWKNPYKALLRALGQGAGQLAGEKVSSLSRKGAQAVSDQLDNASLATQKWGQARLAAGTTAAAAAYASAETAAANARDLVFAAKVAAGNAAQSANDLEEAITKWKRLAQEGRSTNVVSSAAHLAEALTSDLVQKAKAAKDAGNLAIGAIVAAQNAGLLALFATSNTTAAAFAKGASESMALAGSITEVAGAIFGSLVEGALPLVGLAAGDLAGSVLTDSIDFLLADVDIVMPDGTGKESRGVTVHEYGHFALCDMTYRTDALRFGSIWTDVISETVVKQALKQDQATSQPAYMNEGFADFFAGQVAGGINYFDTTGSVRNNLNFQMAWCRPDSLRCLDDNIGASNVSLIPMSLVKKQQTFDVDISTISYNRQVGRITTTIHDFFDGFPNSPAANVPGNSAAWSASGLTAVFLSSVTPGESLNGVDDPSTAQFDPLVEENVSLSGLAIPKFIRRWVNLGFNPLTKTLRENEFWQGLVDTAKDASVSECDICHVFTLHQPDDTCPVYASCGPGVVVQ